MIVVTGATGHLGNVLVRQLLEQGERVRVLIHNGEGLQSLKGLDVERVSGDVCDMKSLLQAFEGAEVVFHLAALVSIGAAREAELHAVNVQGTENILQACKAKHVRRLVYTSSSHIFERPGENAIITEETPMIASTKPMGYFQSKAIATKKVLNASRNGLDAVIAIPTGLVGPYDFGPSFMGQMYLEASSSGRLFYVDGGYNFVDVRDAATGLISMAEKGVSGEMYVLSGEFLSDRKSLEVLARELKTLPPCFRIPPWLALPIAHLNVFAKKMKGSPYPLLCPQAVKEVSKAPSFSCAKAYQQFGFHSRDIESSLVDAIRWFKEVEMIFKPSVNEATNVIKQQPSINHII